MTYVPAKFLRLTVYEEMHLQENTLFDLDLGVICVLKAGKISSFPYLSLSDHLKELLG